jgi:hypothetical protein
MTLRNVKNISGAVAGDTNLVMTLRNVNKTLAAAGARATRGDGGGVAFLPLPRRSWVGVATVSPGEVRRRGPSIHGGGGYCC